MACVTSVSNKDVTVKVEFAPFKINMKKFNAESSNKFGINPDDPVIDYYQLRNIRVTIGNKVVNLPKLAAKDIFLIS